MATNNPSQKHGWVWSPSGLVCSRSLLLLCSSSRNTGRMSSAYSRTCCSSCAPCCICSCMAGAAMDTPITICVSISHHKEVRHAH